VRGLDYYSHTAFEIKSNLLGAQSTVCGGGRYDGLIEHLGGPPTSAIGWAIGMERLVFLISNIQKNTQLERPNFYIVNKGDKAKSFAMVVSRNLRLKNQIVTIDLTHANFTKQLKRADKSGARWAIMIGDDEAKGGEIILKDLRLENKEVSKDEKIDFETFLMRFS